MSNILTAKENFPEERPKWETISQNSSSVKTYWSQWDQLEVHNGVLCRRWESADGQQTKKQVILPQKYRQTILEELHGAKSAGHMGIRKTLEKVKMRYY